MFKFLKSSKSKDIAKKRLQLVLSYERIGIPPNVINQIKEDLINLFSKYPYFDAENIDVNVRRVEEENREELWISIPVKD